MKNLSASQQSSLLRFEFARMWERRSKRYYIWTILPLKICMPFYANYSNGFVSCMSVPPWTNCAVHPVSSYPSKLPPMSSSKNDEEPTKRRGRSEFPISPRKDERPFTPSPKPANRSKQWFEAPFSSPAPLTSPVALTNLQEKSPQKELKKTITHPKSLIGNIPRGIVLLTDFFFFGENSQSFFFLQQQ